MIEGMRADFHIYINRPSPSLMRRARDLFELKPAVSAPFGDVKYPPTVVWTLDDDYHWVHPLNQSFLHNGYQLPDGTQLKIGDKVQVPVKGDKVETLWEAGKYYGLHLFDPEQNARNIAEMDRLLKASAGVHYTSRRLMDSYIESCGIESGYVYPNCLIFDDYFTLLDTTFSRATDNVRVLWQGGASHFADLYPIRESLIRLCRRHPNLQIVVWGQLFQWITQEIPDTQFRWIPWVSYECYKQLYSMLDYDFALAPLLPDRFNAAKSCIKVYEAAATPVPRPTLASRVAPYTDEFTDGENIVFYDPRDPAEFEERFEQLMQDWELRRRIARGAADWIHEHRDARKEALKLWEWLQERREKRWDSNPGLADLVASVKATKFARGS